MGPIQPFFVQGTGTHRFTQCWINVATLYVVFVKIITRNASVESGFYTYLIREFKSCLISSIGIRSRLTVVLPLLTTLVGLQLQSMVIFIPFIWLVFLDKEYIIPMMLYSLFCITTDLHKNVRMSMFFYRHGDEYSSGYGDRSVWYDWVVDVYKSGGDRC